MGIFDQIIGELNNKPPATVPVAMTIAGSDSGGGAGAQADLRTFAACQVHGTNVLTLITAQNTRAVTELHILPEHIIRAQFKALIHDLPPAAAKTGALGDERVLGTVIELLQEHPIPSLVVDPVMVSKHGDPLMPERTQRLLRDNLLEHALLVTPNRAEAEAMTGRGVDSVKSMQEAAKRLFDHGPRYVLIKGSHMDKIVRDLLYDGSGFVEFGADRVDSDRVHGSGCVLSAAIVARLAHGDGLLKAIEFAREFITGAIAKAPKLGEGTSPVNPMHRIWR